MSSHLCEEGGTPSLRFLFQIVQFSNNLIFIQLYNKSFTKNETKVTVSKNSCIKVIDACRGGGAWSLNLTSLTTIYIKKCSLYKYFCTNKFYLYPRNCQKITGSLTIYGRIEVN